MAQGGGRPVLTTTAVLDRFLQMLRKDGRSAVTDRISPVVRGLAGTRAAGGAISNIRHIRVSSYVVPRDGMNVMRIRIGGVFVATEV
jgi:hypothetical protein